MKKLLCLFTLSLLVLAFMVPSTSMAKTFDVGPPVIAGHVDADVLLGAPTSSEEQAVITLGSLAYFEWPGKPAEIIVTEIGIGLIPTPIFAAHGHPRGCVHGFFG